MIETPVVETKVETPVEEQVVVEEPITVTVSDKTKTGEEVRS